MFKEIKEGAKCDSIHESHTILGKMVCVSIHPGRLLLFPFKHWYETRYKGKYRFDRLMFGFHLFLLGVLSTLVCVAIYTVLFGPLTFAKRIHMEATVAPKEVISGDMSTLVIRYTNNTTDDLRQTTLDLTFPDHFLLQEIKNGDMTTDSKHINVGTIPVNGSGVIHVRGTMFGDVGEKQQFKTIMQFVRGTKKDVQGEKIATYAFAPTKSALQTSLHLPEPLFAFQPVSGTVEITNAGSVDFPQIQLSPTWPTDFRVIKTSIPLSNNGYVLPALKAKQSTAFAFSGILGKPNPNVNFVFTSSFVFDAVSYKQETYKKSFIIKTAPIDVTLSAPSPLHPGTNETFTITYKNTSATSLYHIQVGVQSDSPFLTLNKPSTTKTSGLFLPPMDELKPGESKTTTISVPIKSSVPSSERSKTERLEITTHAVVQFASSIDAKDQQFSFSQEQTSKLTTPISFDCFARYVMPSGDQIGRGKLPPVTGNETTYWIFWNIGNTTNSIKDVRIEAGLAPNTTFTGRQSSSEDSGVVYNLQNRKMIWETTNLDPTLASDNKNVGMAFELALKPTQDQIGTKPLLLENIQFTGTDGFTGDLVSKMCENISTNLPNDARAKNKGSVIK